MQKDSPKNLTINEKNNIHIELRRYLLNFYDGNYTESELLADTSIQQLGLTSREITTAAKEILSRPAFRSANQFNSALDLLEQYLEKLCDDPDVHYNYKKIAKSPTFANSDLSAVDIALIIKKHKRALAKRTKSTV